MTAQNPGDEVIDTYGQIAERFDEHIKTSSHNAHYDRPAMLSLLPDIAGKRVLDAGCGSGAYAEWLADRGASVVAVDASPQMIELARAKLAGRAEIHQHDLRQPQSRATSRHAGGGRHALVPVVQRRTQTRPGLLRRPAR